MNDQYGKPAPWDPSYSTERNTRNAATAAAESSERIAEVMKAMEVQVDLAKASRETAERSEQFTRRMAWTSVAIAAASLAASIAAVIVTIALSAG